MSVWLDQYYLRQVSRQLPLFKQKSDRIYNARCVICGDSTTNKSKARWYAFPHKNVLMTKCHNCGYTQPFSRFLEEVDPILYQQYALQKLSESAPTSNNTPQKLPETSAFPTQNKSVLKALKTVSQLGPTHPAKKFIDARRIPSNQHYRIHYTDNFQKFINTILADKFPNVPSRDPRIVLPLIAEDKKTIIGVQGRTILPNIKQRYITIIFSKDHPKLFGLDHIENNREILVVEGPIDSMFVNNCIASCGSDLTADLDDLSVDKDRFIVVYDNEPRNKQIVDKIAAAVHNGFKVTIWPDTVKEKDINDMVLAGMSTRDIRSTIKQNAFSGLEAELRLSQWRKV